MEFENSLPRLQVLDKIGIQKIYFGALEVLERTGVGVKNQEARELLREAGARVKDEVACLPPWLVQKAVSSAPKQIIIYNNCQDLYRLPIGRYRQPGMRNTV